MSIARPMLNPALTPLWRDGTTLQLGADPLRAVVIAGVTAAMAGLLCRLDGSLTRAQALAAGASHSLSPAEVATLLDLLAQAGVLVDGCEDRGPLVHLTTADRDRLAPDLAAWSCAAPVQVGSVGRPGTDHTEHTDRAGSTLARRQRAVVGVQGAGRVGATLVGLLAAAGVGHLAVHDPKPMRGYDVAPGGAGPSMVSRPRAEGALAAARATAPASLSPRRPGAHVDLEVLCPDGPYFEAAGQDQLLAQGVPHLLAATYELVGVVGPLVIPGATACLRCLDLHRVDRDRQWPIVRAQLATPGRLLSRASTVTACDVVLATVVASHAALAALAWLDNPGDAHVLAGAELEIRPPLGVPKRRSWPRHPSCGCDWSHGQSRDGT